MVAGLAGNAEAYHQLLEAVAQRLRVYFTRRAGADCADLEDLVQETLIAIHRKRASYDRTLPFTAWLHAIGRASCRERVCQYVSISVVAVSLKTTSQRSQSNSERLHTSR